MMRAYFENVASIYKYSWEKNYFFFSLEHVEFMPVEVEIFERLNTSDNILLCLRNECN